jgi:hypothetical protein
VNVFDRIEMNALPAQDFSLEGDYPINLSAGSPLDYVRSSHIGGLIGPRKSGANLITVSQIGSGSLGTGNFGYAFAWGADATVGAGTSTDIVYTGFSGIGTGYRFQVDIGSGSFSGRWPDALLLEVWDITHSVRQVAYEASIVGDPDAVAVSEYIGPSNAENDDYNDINGFVTEYVFASEVPGAVFTLDMTRDGASMGNWGWAAARLSIVPPSHVLGRGGRAVRYRRFRT